MLSTLTGIRMMIITLCDTAYFCHVFMTKGERGLKRTGKNSHLMLKGEETSNKYLHCSSSVVKAPNRQHGAQLPAEGYNMNRLSRQLFVGTGWFTASS